MNNDPKLSDDQNTIIKLLRDTDAASLDLFGGYPSIIDYDTIPGYVIVAGVVDGGPKPDLDIYKWSELINRLTEAKSKLQKWIDDSTNEYYGDDDLWEAWAEVS